MGKAKVTKKSGKKGAAKKSAKRPAPKKSAKKPAKAVAKPAPAAPVAAKPPVAASVAPKAPAMPRGPFCQSCGMPMDCAGKFGTNADGAACAEYCVHCYQKGAFTWPDATLERMVAVSAQKMAQATGFALEQARVQVSTSLPTLKRWKK